MCKNAQVFIFLVSSFCFFSFSVRGEFYKLEKILDKRFEDKQYEKLQVTVDLFLHNARDDLYNNSKKWVWSKDDSEVATQVDRHKFMLKWLKKKYENALCGWAFYNVFRDVMRSFSYPVEDLESYDTYTLQPIFSWVIVFNFFHIGLVKYYRSKKILNKKWFSKISPADFFKDCCYYRVKSHLPKKQMPNFSDCWRDANDIIILESGSSVYDPSQLFFIYNNSMLSNWLYQTTPTQKITSQIESFSVKSVINSTLKKSISMFESYHSKWNDFWQLSEKDVKLDQW